MLPFAWRDMDNDDQNLRDTSERSRFSSLHPRTFEAELLISGAVVFGLLQVPPLIARLFDEALIRLEGHIRLIAVYGLTYVTLVVYGLIGAFLIHLVLRAFWIGLVGLESVFPGGVRWDQLKAGPFFVRYARRRMGPLAQIIERVDDICSLIFSFGFMIATVFAYSVTVLTVSAGGSFLISRVFFDGKYSGELFWVLFGSVFGLQIVVSAVDRVLGPRIDADSAIGRALAICIKGWYATSPLRWTGPIQLTMQSNTSNARVTAAVLVAMLGLGTGMIGIMFAQSGLLHFNSLVYFPESLREQGLDPRHYRELREPSAIKQGYPSIQSDVVDGPYLKLFIPYSPRRHNPLIRKRCPDVEPLGHSGFSFGRGTPAEADATRETLECMASLFVVDLDGTTIEAATFEFGIEPGSGLEGLVTHIPVSGLAPGRHELVVLAPSRRSDRDDDQPPTRHIIPFWR